jgi:hypothetical protein
VDCRIIDGMVGAVDPDWGGGFLYKTTKPK